MRKGIDVSERQGRIDWAEVRKAGCGFAVLCAADEKGKKDSRLEENIQGCQRQGIPFSVYCRTDAVLPTQVLREAKQVLGGLEKICGSGRKRRCRIWWTVESDTLKTLGAKRLTGLIHTAQNTVEGSGGSFGIRTELSFYEEEYFERDDFACPFWIIHSPEESVFSFPETPPERRFCLSQRGAFFLWQYTARGRISGVEQETGLDVLESGNMYHAGKTSCFLRKNGI